MALPNLVVSAVAEWNGKALSKASGQIGKFDKTVKNLGRTLGVTFSAAALLAYSKKALAAYGEQIAEAKRLDQALRNIGYSYATAETEGYLDSIEKATGINRDILQPSFIELAQITKSTTIAQSMLNTAMDVSAGTGLDLGSATKILSQAYVGNYKGLQQLNLGLTKAELSSKSYLEIEKLIATQYAGQSKNAADSYQGSLNRLKIAAEQASEQIGQSLVSALSISSGGIDKLIDKVDSAADSMSGLITNVAVLSKDLGDLFAGIPGAGVLDNIKGAIKGRLGALSIGRARDLVDILKGRQGGFPQGVPTDIKNMQLNIEKSKMDKLALARQKELIALQKKAQLAEKNKLSLSKAAAVFDTTRISIAAALQATYDKETRLRLEALMAIEEEDGATALARIGELAAFQKNADLQKLAGVKTISSATLEAINTQLLTELSAINSSKMAEADKEAARQLAFTKYNAAITAAGTLADAASYNERVQIQLTEIARLASMSKTDAAAITAATLLETFQIKSIDTVAAAQKVADDARLKALQAYINLLGTIKVPGFTSSTGATIPGGDPALTAALAELAKTKADAAAADKAAKDAAAAANAANTEALAASAAAAAKIAADAEAALAEIEAALKAEIDALTIKNAAASAEAAAAAAAANAILGENNLLPGSLGSFQQAEINSLIPDGNNGIGGPGAFDQNFTITINTGVGDPEAIARAIEDLLNQSSYRGTSTNRGSGLYIE